MKRVDIKIGFRCNNRCSFCVQGEKRCSLPDKSFEDILGSLKEAFSQGVREVVFTGGEPTLHPNILDLVSEAKKIGFLEIQLQSNGRIFAYNDFCKKAISAGVSQFSPALHGSRASIHDGLTQAKGSCEQTLAGIKNLKNLNQKVLTNTVVTSKNYKDIPALARLFVSLGVDHFQFAFVHIMGRAEENKGWLIPKKSEAISYIKEGLDIGLEAGCDVFTEAIPFCLMGGYENCIAEKRIPDTSIYDLDFNISDYGSYRRETGKFKREECQSCRFNRVCEGPWKEYVDIFGWEEFKPCF